VGEVDPAVLDAADVPERVGWLELDLRAVLRAPHGPGQLRPISRYPSSDVGLSFEVEESVPAGAVLRTIELAGDELLVDAALFDVYRGGAKRSLTYRVRFQAPDRTLTDDELGAARQRLIDAVEAAHPATLRG
jgi:phenylalanyl-tRNA synthetase beta chain